MSDIDFMKKTEKQQERQKLVSETAEKERQQELLDGRQQYQDSALLDETQLKNDAISIGKKKTWKPSEEQKKQNAKIDAGKKLTKLATADTEEIQKIVTESKSWKIDGDDAFRFLITTEFNSRMLTSANIRANFGEYMQIVRCFEVVQGLVIQGDYMGLKDRFEAIREDAKLFYDRMQAYVEANRVDLKGNILDDDQKASEFTLDKEKIRQGNVMKGNAVEDYQYGKLEEIDLDVALKNLNEEESDEEFDFNKAKGKYSVNQHYRIDGYKKFEYMGTVKGDFRQFKDYDTAVSRVNEIQEMREQLRFLKAAKQEGTKVHAILAYSGKTKGDTLRAMAREELELTARLVLAEAEARCLLAQKEGDADKTAAAQKEVEAAWQDYRKIQIRQAKESMPLTARGIGNTTMTRAQAITSDSDAANMAFKKKLSDIAGSIDDNGGNEARLKKVKELAAQYAIETHYTIGCDAETGLLKELKAAVKAACDNGYGAIPEVRALVAHLGTLDASIIPDYDQIPDVLKAGYDFSGKTLKEVTGDKSEPGSTRNAFMNNDLMREWLDVKDMPIFPHEPTINDLRQGKISNCYMLAATTSLIQHDPQAIKNIIRDNGDGTATVRLYKSPGQPVYIRVDKVVPRLKTGGTIMSAGPLWMQLIEMAAAHVGMFKLATSKGKQIKRAGVGSLWYGTGGAWFAMLTGAFGYNEVVDGKTGTLNFPSEGVDDADGVFEAIKNAKADGFIYHLGTKGSTSAGLNSGHAYTVLGAKEVDGVKYITLRNPYANMSYQKDEELDETMTSTYFSSVADSTCGQFDIPLEVLLKSIDNISRTDIKQNLFMAVEKLDDGETMLDKLRTIAGNHGYIPGTEPHDVEFLELDDAEIEEMLRD